MQRLHKIARVIAGLLLAILLAGCVEQLGDGASPPITTEVVQNDSTTQTTQADADVSVLGAQAAAPQVEIYVQPGQTGSGWAADDALGSFVTALEQVKPGMTIVLRGGEYTESMAGNIHYSVSTSGTPDAWVTIAAYPGETPVIRATSGSGIEVHADYVAIDGLTIIGPGDARTSNYGYGVGIGGHHIKVWNSTISAMPGGGIGAGHSSHLWIEGNEIHNNSNWAPEQTSGISTWLATEGAEGDLYPGGYADRIIGNVIYDNEVLVLNSGGQITDGNGIILDNSNINGYAGPTLVANNVVTNNGGAGVVVINSNNVDIAHNTFSANAQTEGIVGGGGEIAVTYDSLGVRATNNIVSPRQGIRAFQYYRATASTENNLVAEFDVSDATYSNADINVASIGFAASGSGLIQQLALSPGSPAVNAANASLLALATDYSGTPRPQGGAPDIGALELSQASAAAATPAPTSPPTTTPATTAPAKSAETTAPKSNAVTGPAASAPAESATPSGNTLPADEQAISNDGQATVPSADSGRNASESTQDATTTETPPDQLAYAELSSEQQTPGVGQTSLLTGLAAVSLTVAAAVALRLTRRRQVR